MKAENKLMKFYIYMIYIYVYHTDNFLGMYNYLIRDCDVYVYCVGTISNNSNNSIISALNNSTSY